MNISTFIMLAILIIFTLSVGNIWLTFKKSVNGQLRIRMMAFFSWLTIGLALKSGTLFITDIDLVLYITFLAVTPVTIQAFCLAAFLKHNFGDKKDGL